MKILLLKLCLLMSTLAFADPITLKGMPLSLQIEKNQAETLNCQSMNTSIVIFLSQVRVDGVDGNIQVWSRQSENAKYPDFLATFKCSRQGSLDARKDFSAQIINGGEISVKFDKTNKMNMIIPSRNLNEEVDLHRDCFYTYGDFDIYMNAYE